MVKEARVVFSDKEKIIIQQIADERGIGFEEAVEALFHEGLAKRVRKKTRHNPSTNVRRFKP